jgi:hypothetical protein
MRIAILEYASSPYLIFVNLLLIAFKIALLLWEKARRMGSVRQPPFKPHAALYFDQHSLAFPCALRNPAWLIVRAPQLSEACEPSGVAVNT